MRNLRGSRAATATATATSTVLGAKAAAIARLVAASMDHSRMVGKVLEMVAVLPTMNLELVTWMVPIRIIPTTPVVA